MKVKPEEELEMKCTCQCWNCAVNNHVGCESHTSICNVEFVRLMKGIKE